MDGGGHVIYSNTMNAILDIKQKRVFFSNVVTVCLLENIPMALLPTSCRKKKFKFVQKNLLSLDLKFVLSQN